MHGLRVAVAAVSTGLAVATTRSLVTRSGCVVATANALQVAQSSKRGPPKGSHKHTTITTITTATATITKLRVKLFTQESSKGHYRRFSDRPIRIEVVAPIHDTGVKDANAFMAAIVAICLISHGRA